MAGLDLIQQSLILIHGRSQNRMEIEKKIVSNTDLTDFRTLIAREMKDVRFVTFKILPFFGLEVFHLVQSLMKIMLGQESLQIRNSYSMGFRHLRFRLMEIRKSGN